MRYVFERTIGKGAFGEMHLYKDQDNPQNKVTVKIDKPNLQSSEAYFTRIFKEDYNLKCIQKYYGDGLHNGSQTYIMLEYLDSTI